MGTRETRGFLGEDLDALDAQCREQPIAWSQAHGGHWALSDYRSVADALRDPSQFRSGRPFIDGPTSARFIPLTLNGSEHAVYRGILMPLFRPGRIALLEPRVRAVIRRYLTEFAQTGGDFERIVAGPVPIEVLCLFLGLEGDVRGEIEHVTRPLDRVLTVPESQAIEQARADLARGLLEDRRNAPRDPDTDFFSALLRADFDGRPLDDSELIDIATQILSAGHGTTSAAFSAIMYRFATDEDLVAGLRTGRYDVLTAIDEILRLAPPLQSVGREVNVPDSFHGVDLGRDDAVSLCIAAANRDPAEFVDPQAADWSRRPNRHLTFGQGVHGCIGAPLARLQLRILVEELLATEARFALSAEPVVSPVRTFRFLSLPIAVTEGAP